MNREEFKKVFKKGDIIKVPDGIFLYSKNPSFSKLNIGFLNKNIKIGIIIKQFEKFDICYFCKVFIDNKIFFIDIGSFGRFSRFSNCCKIEKL